MRLKALANHNRVVRLEDWNGLDLTGTNDMQSILAAAMSEATTAKYPVIGPSGTLLIGSTITASAPLIGPSWPRGSLNAGLRLRPGMTDGTAVLERVLGNGFHFENIYIETTAESPGAAVNATGFKLGTVGGGGAGGVGTATAFGIMRNVQVNGLAVAYELQGWSNEFMNLFAYNCVLGLKGEYMNNTILDIVMGGCAQGFTLLNTGTLTVLRYGEEGTYLTAASTINACSDIIFNNYRTEQPTGAAVPWLKVGETSSGNLVKNLRILSGQLSYSAAGTYPVELDYVDGWEIAPRLINSSTSRRGIKTTVNTRNQYGRMPKLTYGYPFVPQAAEAAITDNRRDLQRPVEIFNANPFMDGVRFGCYDVYKSTTLSLAEDTTTFRTGRSSLKVTVDTGGTYQLVQFRYSEPWVAALAGQTITFAARIEIPSGVDVKGEGGAGSATIYPAVAIFNAADTLIGNSANGYALAGGWNFLHCTATIPAAATEIRAAVYINRSANTSTIGDHINIDFMAIAAGDVWEQIYEGNFVQSQLCRGSVVGGRMTLYMTIAEWATVLADTTQVWKAGDRVIYTDSVAGGVDGQKLTTTGWKDSGVIAL